MPLVRDRCICLNCTEYSETSQILTLLSRTHGIVRAIAKGAHRRTKAGASKFDGGVDLLDGGQAVFLHDTGRDLGTLTEWALADGHRGLRSSLRGLYLGLYAAELSARLIEQNDPHPAVFDRLEMTLGELATPRREQAFVAFEFDLLRETGYLAELGACAGCGQVLGDRGPAYFSVTRGGAICGNCESSVPDRRPIDARLLRLMHSILKLPRVNGATQRLPMLTRHQTDPINRLLADHIQHTLGRPLRVLKYVV